MSDRGHRGQATTGCGARWNSSFRSIGRLACVMKITFSRRRMEQCSRGHHGVAMSRCQAGAKHKGDDMAFTANGVTWGDRTVTYSIATSNIAGQPGGAFGAFITSQAVINQIATAVSWWDGASGLTFQLVADSANVDIRFGYGVVDGGATGRASYSYDRAEPFPSRHDGPARILGRQSAADVAHRARSRSCPRARSLRGHAVDHELDREQRVDRAVCTGPRGHRSLYGDNLPLNPRTISPAAPVPPGRYRPATR